MAGVEGLGGWICFAALRAVKREEGSPIRKLPVTPEMLQWAHDTTKDLGDHGLVVRAALNTGIFFLLRAGEYLKHDGMDWDHRKVLAGLNVDLLDGEGVSAPQGTPPAAVSIRIIGSKTDVYNVGDVRKHFKSDDPGGLCPGNLQHGFYQRSDHRRGPCPGAPAAAA